MTKNIKAVPPYITKGKCNFKNYPFKAWKKLGGQTCKPCYPPRFMHGLAYKLNLPKMALAKKEARLRFVSGYSFRFDTFPDYAFYEIIPLIWDCWPRLVNDVAEFFKRYDVKTAIFTSSQTANVFRQRFPQMNILTITEGVDVSLYSCGKELSERKYDLIEVGRSNFNFFQSELPTGINHIKTSNFVRAFNTDEEFRAALSESKVTINVPRCDVDKAVAGNIETLTQRYWECMLSRMVMVGRAPKELTDLIGYNPVVEWDGNDAAPLISDILSNINDYQELVNKNYETAMKMASWEIRVQEIMTFLEEQGYRV